MQEIGIQKGNIQWKCHIIFGVICALVIGIFVRTAEPGFLELGSPPEDAYYNLLVQGFRTGQLNVKREAPPELSQLADPYNPSINAPYIWDGRYLSYEMSYYKGKLYLYFGVTPALVLFWPYVALTGHYLQQKNGVVIFYVLGFLVSAGLLRAVCRRYFPEVSVWAAVCGILALGLATGILEIISRCDVYEVAISCAYAFTMLTLAAIWCALHEPRRQILWLLLASLAYGLAIGSRPSLVFGAIILLVPVAQAWCAATEPGSRRRVGLLMLATVCPVMLIGLGLMLYNFLRFGNPFEFGWHYQLTIDRQTTARQFSLHYLWLNFRFYFLEPMRWTGHFPYLQAAPQPPLPSGYCGLGESYCGILSNYPLTWLALAAPLAWRGRSAGSVSGLRWFMAAVLLLFVISAITLCLFFSASSRYEMDFLPALMLLAGIGIIGLEQVLVGLPVLRLIARGGWCLLLVYSLVFNSLASIEAHAEADFANGNNLSNKRRADEAVKYLQKALALEPESATFHIGLGYALGRGNRVHEAIVQFQEALALQPKSADAYNALGNAYLKIGDVDEAMADYKKALEINPDFAVTHDSLGEILLRLGRLNEAIAQFQEMVALQPEFPRAHNDLGFCLLQVGRVDEAIQQFQKSLEIRPDYYEAYFNLGYAFYRKGMAAKAIDSYQKAIELQPQFVPAMVNLAWILATWPEPSVRNGDKAVALAVQAESLAPDKDPLVLRTLAAAYAEEGRFPEAVATAKEALALAMSQSIPGLINSLQKEIGLYQTNFPRRSVDE